MATKKASSGKSFSKGTFHVPDKPLRPQSCIMPLTRLRKIFQYETALDTGEFEMDEELHNEGRFAVIDRIAFEPHAGECRITGRPTSETDHDLSWLVVYPGGRLPAGTLEEACRYYRKYRDDD